MHDRTSRSGRVVMLQRAWVVTVCIACLSMLVLGLEHVYSTAAGSSFDVCQIGAGWGCREVINHPFSTFAAIPVALWSLSFYALMIQIGPAGWHDHSLRRLCFVVVLALCTSSVFFLYIIWKDLTETCPLCLTAHTCHFILAGLAIAGSRSSLMKPDDQSSVSRARLAVAPLSVLLAASVVFSWSSGMSENKRFLNTIDANALLRSALQFDFDRYAFSLDYQVVAGSPASPGQLVIVGSLACRHCRNLLREAEALPEVIAKDVGVSFVPFPVSSACNPRVREEERSHRERCRLAERTLKEQLKGNFWPWFRSVDGQPGITIRSLREPDREAAQWSQTLKDQIASLNDIPVYSIPALFWNGQKLPSFVNEFSLEDLLALLIEIEKEVESTREIEGCDEC